MLTGQVLAAGPLKQFRPCPKGMGNQCPGRLDRRRNENLVMQSGTGRAAAHGKSSMYGGR